MLTSIVHGGVDVKKHYPDLPRSGANFAVSQLSKHDRTCCYAFCCNKVATLMGYTQVRFAIGESLESGIQRDLDGCM